MFQLIGGSRGADPGKTAQLKAWTREIFDLPEDATILVSELHCLEEDCPDIETIIAIMDRPGSNTKHKIFKAVSEVTREDVLKLTESERHD